jgi:23S rRNA (uracil1939-C5)-methyltransferase
VKKQKKRIILENILVTDYAAEGKALTKIDGKVIFISGAVPGDTADILITKNKKDWAEGRVQQITSYSKERVDAFCKHFGICGGCRWQMLPYAKQLQYKQQEAEQNLRRIGKVELPQLLPIIGAADDKHYRNKLEFTFSNKRYLLPEEAPLPPEGGFSDPAKSKESSKVSDTKNPPSGGRGASSGNKYLLLLNVNSNLLR